MQLLIYMLTGYLRVTIQSSCPERFLNLCTKQEIRIWNLEQKGGVYHCCIGRGDFKKSIPIQEKTNTGLKIERKCGLPFFLSKYKKRKWLFVGAFCCVGLILGLSQFIWEIKVEGNVSYTEEDIKKYINRNEISLGTLRRKVNCEELEEKLRRHYDEIAWISCSIDGCQLSVRIKETLDKNTKNETDQPCDLVALKDGIITSIVTQNGTPLVKKGDKVKKGETLITGNIYIYSDSNEVLETHQVPADGMIWARTKVDYSCSFSRSYYKKKYGKKKNYTYAVIACGKWIPLMPTIKQKEGMDQIKEKYPWKLGNSFYLPITIEKTTTRKYETKRIEYSKKEAYKEMERRIQRRKDQLEKKGIEVEQDAIKIEVNEQTCKASGTMILKEPIGKVRAIRKLTKKQEEKIRPTEAVLW